MVKGDDKQAGAGFGAAVAAWGYLNSLEGPSIHARDSAAETTASSRNSRARAGPVSTRRRMLSYAHRPRLPVDAGC